MGSQIRKEGDFDMIEKVITISLIIVSIHVSLMDGMIFGQIRQKLDLFFDRIHMEILRMPLYECIICMGGIWSLIIYPILYGWSWDLIPTMLCVIGFNTLISPIITKMHEYGE